MVPASHLLSSSRLLGAALALVMLAGCGAQSSSQSASPTGAAEPAASEAASASPTASSSSAPLTLSGQPADSGASGTQEWDQVPAKDSQVWTLPSDPYIRGFFNPRRDEAHTLIMNACMAEAGYPGHDEAGLFPLEAVQPSQLGVVNGQQSRFNETRAAEHGYRLGPEIEQRDGGPALKDTDMEAWSACSTRAGAELEGKDVEAYERELDDPQADPRHLSIILAFDEIALDESSSALEEPAAAWRQCMAPLVIEDLPDRPWSPDEMPRSLVERWQWAALGTPSSDEISVATADAACRRSSGWFSALYEDQWSRTQAYIDTHRAETTRALEDYRADDARYQQLIEDYS